MRFDLSALTSLFQWGTSRSGPSPASTESPNGDPPCSKPTSLMRPDSAQRLFPPIIPQQFSDSGAGELLRFTTYAEQDCIVMDLLIQNPLGNSSSAPVLVKLAILSIAFYSWPKVQRDPLLSSHSISKLVLDILLAQESRGALSMPSAFRLCALSEGPVIGLWKKKQS